MNIKFIFSALLACILLSSCDSSDSNQAIITNPPIEQRPVVLLPITSADIPNLNLLYVGLSADEAVSVASQQKHIYRVVSIDGKGLAVTEDYVNGRVNATIVKNRVVSISVEILNL